MNYKEVISKIENAFIKDKLLILENGVIFFNEQKVKPILPKNLIYDSLENERVEFANIIIRLLKTEIEFGLLKSYG